VDDDEIKLGFNKFSSVDSGLNMMCYDENPLFFNAFLLSW